MAAALRRDVPTNMRVMAESFFGEERPITEKDFRPEELQAMRAQILRKRVDNADTEEMYRHGSQYFDEAKGDWVDQDFSEEIESFEKTRGKTAVRYDDYENNPYSDERGEGESSILRSFTDPEYNVATTLGQYVAFKDEDGKTKIKDVYDWRDVDTEGMTTGDIVKAFMAAENLRQAGNVAVRAFKPDIRREVAIDLGMVE